MKPLFKTDRLAVFSYPAEYRDDHVSRDVFVAHHLRTDWPGPVVVACVCTGLADALGGPYLDWIQTTTPNLRQGFARELWQGIETHLGAKLVADGASEEGDALCEHMEDRP